MAFPRGRPAKPQLYRSLCAKALWQECVDHPEDETPVTAKPAIAEVDETFEIETPLGRRVFHRATGEVLHPEREPLAVLEGIRRTIGEYNFAGQYQQAPAPTGGGLVREAWFLRYQPDDLPREFDQIVQSWDTAGKPSELADYSVCAT